MRRIQVFMDEHLDDQLEAEAAGAGVSKASIIRECVATRYALRRDAVDPIDALIGAFDGDPLAEDEHIDDIVYGVADSA